jgi:hypothetical protein
MRILPSTRDGVPNIDIQDAAIIDRRSANRKRPIFWCPIVAIIKSRLVLSSCEEIA